MKNSILICILSIAICSCKKENDTSEKNHFKVGEAEYALDNAFIINYGRSSQDYEGYNLDLILYSQGLKISSEPEDDEDISGKGHVFYFEMFCHSKFELDEGMYTFSEMTPYEIGTFDESFYFIDYDAADPENATENYIEQGWVEVTQQDNGYLIIFEGIDEYGNKIEGRYEGDSQYFSATMNRSATQKKYGQKEIFSLN